MNVEKQHKIRSLTVDSQSNLLSALQLMDEHDVKLLIVEQNGYYHSLLSIGDVQRAIIRGTPLDAPVSEALRVVVTVCTTDNSAAEVKNEMVSRRTEFMPVLDEAQNLADVVFWDEIFDSGNSLPATPFNIPVVVMAGGKGSRLAPITNIIPKPLVPIGDKPIVEAIIEQFVKHGCDRFILSVNHKAEMIESYFGSLNPSYGVEFVQEQHPMGTAGSLSLLKDKIDSTFFVSNCDILVEQDFGEVLEFHRSNKNEITVVAALRSFNIPYGTVRSDDEGLLTAITEKPQLNYFVNSGMYLIEPHIIDEVPVGEFTHITDLMQTVTDRGGRVGVFPVSENSWMDIGEWPEYQKTVKRLTDDKQRDSELKAMLESFS